MIEREKIAQIIAEHLCPQGKAHKTLYGAERRCYSRDNFAECEKVSKCVDALIKAGVGDVKRHRVFVSKDGKEVKQLYSGEEVENIVKERNELKVELRDKVDYIHEQDEVIKEYKHRAARAERALDKVVKLFYEYRIESDVLSCSSCWIADEAFKKCEAQGLYKGCPQRWKEEILIQAEKELQEEKGD